MAVRTPYEAADIRKILIGMVTDRTVCARISSKWTGGGLFAQPWANAVGSMAVNHYKKFGMPPARLMPSIYEDWAKTTSQPAEEVATIEQFLIGLSAEHELQPETSEYVLDVAGRHFNKVEMEQAVEAVAADLKNYDIAAAEARLQNVRRINLGVGAYDELLVESAREKWREAFSTEKAKPLVEYRGPLQDFMGDAFQRGRLFAFMAPDKTGKTAWLIDLAYRALRQGRRVAFFDTGDGVESEFIRRIGVRSSGRPLRAGPLRIPRASGPCPTSWDTDELLFDEPVYDVADPDAALDELRKVARTDKSLRTSFHGAGSLSAADLDGLLADWDRAEWRADVCIASGSLVLTDRGLVPIEKICNDDLLWDGLSWVRHGGLVFKGVKNVIEYSGLVATPEHRIWTDHGWRTIESCKRLGLRVARTGEGRRCVRVGEDYISDYSSSETAYEKREMELCEVCKHRMHQMQTTGLDYARQSVERHYEGLSGMYDAEKISNMVLFQDAECKGEVSKSKGFKMEGLRRPGNRISISNGCRCLPMGHRELRAAGSFYGNRSKGQQRALRAGESTLFYETAELPAHSAEMCGRDGLQISANVSRCKICGQNTNQVFRLWYEAGRNYSTMERHSSEVRKSAVWDIRNAGPLHRFTVQGVLAHNCIVDYADILAPPSGIKDTLDQIDETWKTLHRIAQQRHCLVVTATQASALAYGKEDGLLSKKHFSGRKTKLAHVDGMLGINVSADEKERGMARINWIVRRAAAYNERHFCRVAGNMALANPAILSKRG